MARKKKPQVLEIDIAAMQPSELNELKKTAKEYLTRLENIENEMDSLKEAKKDLKDEFEQRLDVKVLEQVIKVLKIESQIDRKGTYDALTEVLKDDFVNNVVDEPEE